MNTRDTTSGNRAKEKLFERERGITGLTRNSRQEGPKDTEELKTATITV